MSVAHQTVLVTGGAGYIGSHTCLVLLQAGVEVVVVDNLDNSTDIALDRVRALAGLGPHDPALRLHVVDLRDAVAIDAVIAEVNPDAVIHFAGRKAVGESVSEPLRYYDHNVVGTVHLLEAMQAHDVRDLVFSSSATVYGIPERVPITEDAGVGPINPYGRTKLVIEDMLRDVAASDPRWRIAALRYFNPVGAHASGRIGEDPSGIPNNLMPFVMQVAVGRREHLSVYGDDYETPDGTCIRDYIHVVDLAEAHLAALHALDRLGGCRAVNIGTGHGSSVFDVIHAAAEAAGRPIPYEVVGRRAGDAPCAYADASLAAELLGWRATRDLATMCHDHWRWQRDNPHGYGRDGH